MKSSPPRSPFARRRLRRATLWKSGACLTTGILSVLACTCSVRTASAQAAGGAIYYWDGNGATPGSGATPTGIWGGASDSGFWSTDSTGSTATSSTGPGVNDVADFTAFSASGTNPSGSYTVTLGAPESVYGVTIGNTNDTSTGTDGQLSLVSSSTNTLTIGAGGLTLNNSSGDPTVSGAIILGADQTWTINNAHVIANSASMSGNATAGNTRTWTLGFVGQYTPTVSGVLSDGTAGGILALTLNNVNAAGTAIGGGTWNITGTNNSYTGATTIAAGNLQFASLANTGTNSSLGAGGNINFGSGTLASSLTYNGSVVSTTNRAVNLAGTTGAVSIYNNSGTAANTLSFTGSFTNTGGGAKTLTFRGSNLGNNTFGSALADSSAGGGLTVTKADAGQWTLGGNNTFSGKLNVGAGTLNLTNTNSFTGGISITGGTLSVAAAGTLGSNVASNSISIAGGNLLLAADSNVGNNQTIMITSAGGGIGVSAAPGVGFPSITAAAGAPIVFGLNYTGTGGIGATGGTGSTDVPGVDALFTSTSATFLGSFAAGTGTGTYTGTSLPVGAGSNYRIGGGGGTITFQNSIFTGANNLLVGTTGGGTVVLPNANTYTGTTTIQNGTLTAASLNSVAGGTASSSLGAPTTVTNGTITIGSGANTVALNYSGAGQTTDRVLSFVGLGGTVALQNSGTGAVTFSSAPTFAETGAETLQLGAATDTLGGTIGSITDSTAATAKTSLVKLGLSNSTWNIGASTYTGTTTINGGVLSSPDVLASSPLITLNGSSSSNLAVLQTSGTFARTLGANAVAGSSILNLQSNGGFAAFGGKLTVTLNAGAAIAYGSGGFFPNNGTLTFGSTTANNQVELTNSISLQTNDNFQRAIYVEKGAGGDSALLSGVLTNTPSNTTSNPGIVKQGKGMLILSGANTFSGPVTVSAGSLVAGTNSTGTTSGAFGTGTGPSGTPTTPSAIVVGDGNTGSGGNPAVLIGGAFSVDRKFTFNDSGTNNTYSIGATTDNNSSFTGAITVNTGSTAANNNTFSVTQVATTGTNALNITGGITSTVGGAKTINFNDAGAVNVTTVGITNGGGTFAVNKLGAGTLTLSAANNYTGATTINAGTVNLTLAGTNSGTAITGGTLKGATPITVNGGTLSLAANNTLTPTSTVTLGGGVFRVGSSVLQGQGATHTAGAVSGTSIQGAGMLSLAANSTLNYAGTAGTVVFNGFAPAGFTLNVTGTNFGTATDSADGTNDRLIFTTTLTAAQLAEITFTFGGATVGATETALDSTFFEVVPSVTAVPEPSTWALCLAGSLLLGAYVKRRRVSLRMTVC